ATMKAIVLIGIMVLVAFCIFEVLSGMQRQSTDKMIREDTAGFFQMKKKEAQAASADGTEPIPHRLTVPEPSWPDQLQNTIAGWTRSIKGGVQQMLPQPPPSQAHVAPPPAMAGDFKTMNGKEYKDATVTRVEIDGITVKTKSGISKLYFADLPKEVQQC